MTWPPPVCTSDDPNNHQGDFCPLHEGGLIVLCTNTFTPNTNETENTMSNVKLNPTFVELVDGIKDEPAAWKGHRIQILDEYGNIVEGCDIVTAPTYTVTITGTVQVPFTVEVEVEEGDYAYDEVAEWIERGADPYKADEVIREFFDSSIDVDSLNPDIDTLEVEDVEFDVD